MRRIIREEEPPRRARCSARSGATTRDHLADRGGIDRGSCAQLLRGDLDWIVMKALEKDRERRYATANGLARDVERYLRDEPVEARPPSSVYRFRKFARRNRVALVTTALVAAALSGHDCQRLAGHSPARPRRWPRPRERSGTAAATRGGELPEGAQAVDDYVFSVRDSKLLTEANYQPLRKELIESTLAYYRQFVEQYQDDPDIPAGSRDNLRAALVRSPMKLA